MGERMNQSKALASHIPITTAAFVVLTIALICGLVGQKAWSHQTSLTKNFETCMEAAPFKNPLSHGKGEAVMTPEDLPRHFEVFDQIFRETGLPPIWDGKNWCLGRCSTKNQFWLLSSATKNLGFSNHNTS